MIIPCPKRSRSSEPPASLKSTIDDLPDIVMVEILCRLPHTKLVCRCKIVSKRWRTLISHPSFLGRFLRLHHDQQKPLLHAYILRAEENKTLFLTTSSSTKSPPVLQSRLSTIFSLLPNWTQTRDDPDVAGICNDLVLCCPTQTFQRDYYICNSYTKEWTRLLPTPRVYAKKVVAGLICEPYYSINEDNTIKLNDEYRFRVVRLLPNSTSSHVDIFSSETNEWKEHRLSEDTMFHYNFSSFDKAAFACNGKLYWYNSKGFIFEMDPFSISSHFINAPVPLHRFRDSWHIGVCRGRLRMCRSHVKWSDSISVWELNENQEWCLIFSELNLFKMVCKQSFIHEQAKVWSFDMVHFHPSDGDVLYLKLSRHIVMCNLGERTLEVATKLPFQVDRLMSGFSYLFPWWPTPVQKRIDSDTSSLITS